MGAANVAFAACDAMTLTLPGMTAAATKLTASVVAAGGATCGGVDAFLGPQAGKLTLTFNGAVDTIADNKYCTYKVKAITTAKVYVAANSATRTAEVKIAAATDIAAAKITTSTKTGTAPAPDAGGGASSYSSAPPSPPAPAKHYIEAEVKLDGITAAQFDAAAKTAFKEVIAASLEGVKANDVYDVKAVDARRAGVKVSFKVKVADAAKAAAGATTLNTFLKKTGDDGFLNKLKAKGGNLAKVTGVTVTKAPAAKTSTTVSGVAKTSVVSLTSLVALAFAFLGH